MSAWTEVLRRIREFDELCHGKGSAPVYRGQRRPWPLKASLHRHIERLLGAACNEELLSEPRVHELLHAEAKTLYARFRRDAWPLLGERERSAWGVLFTMQHHNIPTRLLDWTDSFACALFFAQLGRAREDTAVIWALDPQEMNRVAIGVDGLLPVDGPSDGIDPAAWLPASPPAEPLPSVFGSALYTNARMTAQRSAFVVMGDSFEALDQQFGGQLVRDGHMLRVELPPDTFEDAEEFLALAGISAYSYFPDLHGLAMRHEEYVRRTIRDVRRFYPEMYRRD